MKRFIPIFVALMPSIALADQALGNTGSDFTYDKLVAIAIGLVNILLEMAGIAAVIAIVYYGIRMAISGGDAGKFSEARKGLLLSFVGAAIIFGVYTIIETVRAAVKSVG